MLSKRIPLGLLMIAALVGMFYLDARLAEWAGGATRLPGPLRGLAESGAIVAVLAGSLAAVGGLEFVGLARAWGYFPSKAVVAIFSVLTATCPWWTPAVGWTIGGTIAGLVVSGLMAAAAVELIRGRIAGAAGGMATTMLGVVYLGVLTSFLVRLRVQCPVGGTWLLLMVLGVIKMSDVGAFFVGKFFGKRKLCPSISPGKTWAGLFGAIAGATASCLVFSWLGDIIGFGRGAGRWLGAGQAIVFGPAVAVVGQLGDLTESLLKRSAGRKDSGQLVPEFGGVLDLLDSPLMVGPLAYWVLAAGWGLPPG